MNNMLTAAQVTSQFLYGTDTPPTGAALVDQNFVGRTTAGTLPKLDTIAFMTDGPGKFAKPSQSYLVTAFFNDGLGFPPIQPGTSMSASAYAALNGLDLGFRVTQLFYSEQGESEANIAERVYIYNTQDYEINPDAMLTVTEVVDPMGNTTIVKSIENLNVIMPRDDNFDFVGGRTSQVAALFLQPRVDPWNIGVTVQEDYTLPTYNIGSYSEAQWAADTSYILSVYNPISAPAATIFSGLTTDLFDNGITKFIDDDGRAIVYGTVAADVMDDDFYTDGVLLSHRAPLLADAMANNGVHVVAGVGADKVTGTVKGDILEGGKGNDTLVGGDGVDKLYGGDGADILVLGNIDGVNAAGAVTSGEVIEGGAGTDYLVVTAAMGDTIKVGKGDADDRLLIHSDFLGLPASGDGKIGLFALLGGVAAVIPYSVDYEVIEIFDQNSIIFQDEQGRSYRSYAYQDGEIGSTPTALIEYRHFLSDGSLDIVISSPPTGNAGPQYLQTITIDNFSNGDYGIKLDVFLPFGVVLPGWYYNFSYLDSFDWSVAAAYDSAVIAISEAARNYSLTADGTFSGQGLRAAFAATPEITAGSLMIAIDGKESADALVGNDVAELIDGGAGDDTLTGNGGDDRYIYRRGDGNDTIHEASVAGGDDTLKFLDITADEVELKRVGNDIFVRVSESAQGAGDAGSVMLLGSAVLNQKQGVEFIQLADGTVWDHDAILAHSDVNMEPVARDDGPLQMLYNTTQMFAAAALLANDTDADGDVLTILGAGTATHGSVVLLADGRVSFTADADYRGAASFTYTISDGAGGVASAVVSLDVQGIAGRTITGTATNNSLVGTAFDDTISGLAGNDRLNGNGGVDRLIGGVGNDTYIVNSVGDTTVELADEGSDIVQSSMTWTLGANLEKLTLLGTADINGSGNDLANVVTGNSGENILTGGSANDVLRGMDGKDRLLGGGGNDRLDGGAGSDIINGGDGVDTLEFLFAAAGVGVDLSFKFGKAGEAFGDTYVSIENVSGTAFDDELTGDSGVNRLTGNAGRDVLNGMAGRDVLIGGAGRDVLTGGADADVFQFAAGSGEDVITDFWAGQGRTDRIQFTGQQFLNFADMIAHSSNSDAGLLIDLGAGNMLTLTDVFTSQLRADDFLFA